MKAGFLSALAFLLLTLGASAQNSTTRIPFVQAQGMGTVTIQPDQAILDLSVMTQASTATAASAQNATQVTSVISALTNLLGASASIKTVSYSLNANYSYPSNGQSVLTGYTAVNTVEATISDLTVIGQTIDAGVQAGAGGAGGEGKRRMHRTSAGDRVRVLERAVARRAVAFWRAGARERARY